MLYNSIFYHMRPLTEEHVARKTARCAIRAGNAEASPMIIIIVIIVIIIIVVIVIFVVIIIIVIIIIIAIIAIIVIIVIIAIIAVIAIVVILRAQSRSQISQSYLRDS